MYAIAEKCVEALEVRRGGSGVGGRTLEDPLWGMPEYSMPELVDGRMNRKVDSARLVLLSIPSGVVRWLHLS
jgi:hypothetical protein